MSEQRTNRTRAFRCEDDLWAKAMRRAAERDETLSEAIRKFLERYSR